MAAYTGGKPQDEGEEKAALSEAYGGRTSAQTTFGTKFQKIYQAPPPAPETPDPVPGQQDSADMPWGNGQPASDTTPWQQNTQNRTHHGPLDWQQIIGGVLGKVHDGIGALGEKVQQGAQQWQQAGLGIQNGIKDLQTRVQEKIQQDMTQGTGLLQGQIGNAAQGIAARRRPQ